MLKPLSQEELKILNALEENSRIKHSILAKDLDIDEKLVSQIITDLEKEQIILKYKAIVNWEQIESQEVSALIQVTVTPQQADGFDQVAQQIASFDEVATCLLLSGSFDLLVEVTSNSLKDVAFFVSNKLATINGVTQTKTNFLLKRYKMGGDLIMASKKTHRLPVFI